MSIMFTLILLATVLEQVRSWSGNVCSVQVCGWREEKQCAYRTWNACCAWKTVKVSYYYTSTFCCNGWTTSTNENCNVAICSPGCMNGGSCTTPNTCSCPSPYVGQICNGVAACSHLRPCYPGVCSGSDSCMCSNGFNGDNCLNFQDEKFRPSINRCNATFTYHSFVKNMDIYKYFGDASNSDQPSVLWTNQADFNLLEMTMEAIYDTKYNIQQPLPALPTYVNSFKLGIVSANVTAKLYKVSGNTTYNRVYTCNEPSNDRPILNSLLVCRLSGTNDVRVDSGDRFVLTFTATSGGFIEYTSNGGKKYYTGKTAQNSIEFKFDHEEPIHCITSSPACADTPLHVQEDITKKSINVRWGGWTDSLSGIEKYSVELWEMEYSKDELKLREPLITDTTNPVPEFIQEFNAGSTQNTEITPKRAGVYSVILEVSDKANNTRYARRFVIYDPTSTITIQEYPLFCSTASRANNYLWQTDINNDNGATRINFTWTDHFINRIHHDGHFLSGIGKYQPRLTDGRRRVDYKKIDDPFDDNEGTRNKSAISNVNGIVKFAVAYQTPPTDSSNVKWTDLTSLVQSYSLSISEIVDGSARQFFVKATDIMGNQKIDNTTVYFDSTKPAIFPPKLDYNVKDSVYDFASRFTIETSDPHSGVPTILLQIVTRSGLIKTNHTYPNPSVGNTCNVANCYCINNNRECYKSKMTLDVNNCWMKVGIKEIDTEMHSLEISAFNGAGLSEKKKVDIADVKNLTGVQNYFGVANLQLESTSDTGFRIKWTQPKSCYERLGILLQVTDPSNRTTDYKIFKDATEYFVGGLNPSTSYSFKIFTKYGTDDNFEMSEPVSMSLLTAEKQTSGLDEGGIVGIVCGFLVLILIFVILLIFLHRTGRLNKTKERVATTFTHIRQSIARKDGFSNRAFSDDHDNDIYFYGGMQFQPQSALSRQSISFDCELSRGRFAIIYKAFHYKQNKEAETVAAKTLKDPVNEEDVMKMRAKINFYETKVGHNKNILNFIGAVEDDVVRGPFMVLEYCENGSLKDYLKSKKSNFNEDLQERLYRFSFGICKGMDYLAEKGIVHRRLAARNVLLDFLLEPKITGFGPDPSLNDDNSDSSERIPVKWMAPECMTSTKKANERSDVWSYGIVLWEIFSLGETPYPDVRSQDLPSYLKQNRRMSKPECCDDSFYEMMMKCWQYEQRKRPNFKKMNVELSDMFNPGPGDEYYYRLSTVNLVN